MAAGLEYADSLDLIGPDAARRTMQVTTFAPLAFADVASMVVVASAMVITMGYGGRMLLPAGRANVSLLMFQDTSEDTGAGSLDSLDLDPVPLARSERWPRILRYARSAGGLEQLDGIPVGILYLDLSTARTRFHLVAKAQSGLLLQFSDEAWKISDLQHHPVPAARLLLLSVRHRPRTRRARTAEQDLRAAKRDVPERRQVLVFEREPEVLRVKRHRARHILHLVPHTVDALHEWVSLQVTGLRGLNHVRLSLGFVLRPLEGPFSLFFITISPRVTTRSPSATVCRVVNR
jgi:hypothetical protein